MAFDPHDPDGGNAPISAADWVGESEFQRADRRPLTPVDRRGLANLGRLMASLNLTTFAGDYPPGSLVWWPTSESGVVSAYGNHDLYIWIDLETAYWQVTARRHLGEFVERRGYGINALRVLAGRQVPA